jgi:hypothetical protein
MRRKAVVTALGVLTFLAVGSSPLLAQTGVSSAQAQPFLGQWSVSIDGGQGPINIQFNIMDMGGMIHAQVSNPDGSMIDAVPSLSGSDLVLNYSVDIGGQGISVQLTLTPNGDGLNCAMSAADGQFSASGTATRQ